MSEGKGTWADVSAAVAVASGKKREPVESKPPGLIGDVDTGDQSSEDEGSAYEEAEDLDRGHSPKGKDPAIMEHMGAVESSGGRVSNPFVAPEGAAGRLISKGISEREVELVGTLVYDRVCKEFGVKRGVKIGDLVESNMAAIGTTMANEDEALAKQIGSVQQSVARLEASIPDAASVASRVKTLEAETCPQLDARVLSCEAKVQELALQLSDNLSTIKEATEKMTAALVKYAPLKADDEDETKSLPSTVTKAKHTLVDISSRLAAVEPIAAAPPPPVAPKKIKKFDY